MFLGEQDGPGQAGHRDPLTGAARAQGLVHGLDIMLGFGQKPFAEMAIDLMTTLMQFIGWQPLQVTGAFGGKKFLREPFRQFFRMDYRGIIQLLKDFSDLPEILGLKKVPNFSTLCYAEERLLKKSPSSSFSRLYSAVLESSD